MHYYQHHIGDFIKDTANLDDHQMATYLRMLWAYYDSEKPISGDLEDIAFAMRTDEKTVRLLLRHFFKEQPDGWHHTRCDKELAGYKSRSEKAAKSANARWTNANALPTDGERKANATHPDANQEPRTINQEPKKTGRASAARTLFVEKPETVSQSVWDDFLKHRRAKGSPLTQTAMNGIKREADKAGWTVEGALSEICSRGWTGFKADWVAEPATPAGKWGQAPAAPVFDPDSRSAIEAEALAMGIGPWDQLKEQWSSYKRRVRGPGISGFAPSIVSLVGDSLSKVSA